MSRENTIEEGIFKATKIFRVSLASFSTRYRLKLPGNIRYQSLLRSPIKLDTIPEKRRKVL